MFRAVPFIVRRMPLGIMDGGRLNILSVFFAYRWFASGTSGVADNDTQHKTRSKAGDGIQHHIGKGLQKGNNIHSTISS